MSDQDAQSATGQSPQLFGLEGIEQSQGFVDMPLADAPVEDSAADFEKAVNEFTENRPDPAPIVERQYIDVETRQPRPNNEVVDIHDAAKHLTAARNQEAEALEQQRRAAIAAEADALRGIQQPEATPAADAPAEAQPQPAEVQPQEQPQPQPQAQSDSVGQGPSWGERLANDPEMLAAVSGWAQQVQGEVQQHTEAASNIAVNYIKQAANLAALALFSDTELAGVPAEGIEGALKMLSRTNPQRAEQLIGKIQHLQTLQAQAQVAAHEQAQVRQRQLQAWGLEQDRIFDAVLPKMLPGVDIAKVKAQAPETLRNAGIDDATMRRLWNESDVFRSSAAQVLLSKAAAWDAYQADLTAARAALNHHRNNPVPNVQKPGVSSYFAERQAEAIRMPSEFSSAKQAAEWLTARRGRNAR
jgi:hypothetical protein